MNKIPLDILYDRNKGKLSLQPKLDLIRLQDEDLRDWGLNGGMIYSALDFRSPSRERMLAERRNLEEEIDGMLLQIQDTFRNIHRKELALRKQARSFAPIGLLPPEILRRILAALDPISLPSDKDLLICLMLVCRLWAATISDMPELWTNIVTEGDRHERWLARHVDKWKAAPLNVVYRRSIQCGALLDNIVMRSPNWRRFQFDPTPHVNNSQVLRLWTALHQATSLRELDLKDSLLTITDILDQSPDQSPISLPSLKTLKLAIFSRIPCFLRLPSLTYIEYGWVFMTADQFHGWADQMRSLRCMCIDDLYLTRPELECEWLKLINSPAQFPLLEKMVVKAGPRIML